MIYESSDVRFVTLYTCGLTEMRFMRCLEWIDHSTLDHHESSWMNGRGVFCIFRTRSMSELWSICPYGFPRSRASQWMEWISCLIFNYHESGWVDDSPCFPYFFSWKRNFLYNFCSSLFSVGFYALACFPCVCKNFLCLHTTLNLDESDCRHHWDWGRISIAASLLICCFWPITSVYFKYLSSITSKRNIPFLFVFLLTPVI